MREHETLYTWGVLLMFGALLWIWQKAIWWCILGACFWPVTLGYLLVKAISR